MPQDDIAIDALSVDGSLAVRQLEMEAEGVAEAHRRLLAFAASLQEAAPALSPAERPDHARRASGATSRSPAAMALLLRSVRPVAEEIEAVKASAMSGRPGRRHAVVPLLKGISAEDAAVIALRSLLDAVGKRSDFSGMCAKVGKRILRERAIAAWAENNQAAIRHVRKRFKTQDEEHHFRVIEAMASRSGELKADGFGPEDTLRIGLFFVELVILRTGFFEKVYERTKDFKQRPRIAATDKLTAWMRQFYEARAASRPVHSPMVIPPRDWARGQSGGFHFAQANTVQFVHSLAPGASGAHFRDTCGDTPIAAINHLQRTPWRINRKVLEVFREAVLSGGNIGGLGCTRERELPSPLVGIPKERASRTPEQQAQVAAHSAICRHIHDENFEIRRRVFNLDRTLAVAEEHENDAAIYFAMHGDFRGRFYYASPALSPQGADEQRALIEFASGAVLDTAQARELASHGAARLGYCPWTGEQLDKAPRGARLEWVHGHSADICAVAEAPLDLKWWSDASDPWQFLAFCFAWADFLRGEQVRLPLQLDGTTNGFQHLAAIARDRKLAKASALTKHPLEPAEWHHLPDIYRTIGAAISARREDQDDIRDAGAGGRLPSSQRLPDFTHLLTRKAIKQVVIPVPMGGTLQGGEKKLLKFLIEDNPEAEWPEAQAAAKHLAKAIHSHLYKMFPSLSTTAKFIKAVASAAAREKKDMEWISPSGFPCVQKYRELAEGTLVRLRFADRVAGEVHQAKVRPLVVTERLNANKARASSIANAIQSLDAAHMHKVAARCAERGVPIGYIHDCVLYPAEHHAFIERTLREEFIETHRAPFLQSLLEQVRAQLTHNPKLGAPPLGDFNLEEVKDSDYFFY